MRRRLTLTIEVDDPYWAEEVGAQDAAENLIGDATAGDTYWSKARITHASWWHETRSIGQMLRDAEETLRGQE